MKNNKTQIAAAAALAISSATAAQGADGPAVKVGGQIYSHYGMDLTAGADDANAFDISRAYVTVKAKVTETLSTRVTTDVGRLASQRTHGDDGESKDGEDTKIQAFLKYAYVQWQTPVDGVQLQFGAAGTGWTGLYDKFWGRRWVSKSFADQTKLLPTSDLGVHALGSHIDGLVQWHGGLINGAGYSKPEDDKGKTAQLRLTIDPLSPGDCQLPISAFVSQDVGADGDAVTLLAGGLGYKSALGLLWFELENRSEGDATGQGLSASVVPHLGDVASLLFRLDRWDPDTDADDDATTRIIGGVTRDFAKEISVGLLYERSAQEGQDEPSHGVFVRTQAGF